MNKKKLKKKANQAKKKQLENVLAKLKRSQTVDPNEVDVNFENLNERFGVNRKLEKELEDRRKRKE